ncbi:PREDICTED: C-factor-like [Gekko japonicus]|uniref:C-factor-like n=1 Tax=Gekko japonicus TaxID=146911 RepID=A0ABM1KNL4_GEKJA|nr:PREDICTED: C-factor-like [Gekko japonicus]
MEGFKIESVLVTGSDRGIGLGLVQRFVELPHPPQLLFATCRHPEGPEGQVLKEMATRCSNISRLVVLQLDVTDPHSIRAAAEEVEKYLAGRGLNLLINNAGIACATTLASETAQSMAAVYATNTIGPMQVCQAFLPLLKRAALRNICLEMCCSKAAIVNMSSSYGSIATVDEWEWHQDISYRCSKAALNMLTRCQSRSYGICGILCVSLHPGDVKTHLEAEKGVLTVDSSTRGILELLSRLSAKDNGAFLDWRGQTVPW